MLARLLVATIETLEHHGLAGTTIPRVAAVAGVAPASVYRRFPDKDALFRAAFLSALEDGGDASRRAVRRPAPKQQSLEAVVRDLVAEIGEQYRDRPGLLRALVRFVETDTDRAFRKEALRRVACGFGKIGDALLAFRQQIRHTDPERAVLFGLLTVVTILEVRALDEVSMWRELLPVSDEETQAELVRMLLAYLQSP
ncbi:MAG: hypothetical protein NVS3B16_25940 [Vulcanimicrobiaceae bacterium]